MKNIFLVLFCLLLELNPLIVIADEENAKAPIPGPGIQALVPGSKADGAIRSSRDPLQFTTDGHIMGFKPNGVYLVNTAGILSMEFIGTRGVRPKTAAGTGRKLSHLVKVEYEDLWEGITLSYEGSGRGIAESTYRLQPGADAGNIRLKYSAETEVQKDGSLKIKLPTARGWMTESKPVAWQMIGGKRIPVEVSFMVDGGRIGFEVGDYDKGRELIIDPIYEWHTFYGSSSSANAMAMDNTGNIYITGYSTDTWNGDGGMPPLHAYNAYYNNLFILKLNSSGAYQWHTFYGSLSDSGSGIAVDGDGNIYVTGYSETSWNGDGDRQPLHANSGSDIVVLKLNGSGAYQWHTFYGSSGANDLGWGIAIDAGDNVYVTGYSDATWDGDEGQTPIHAHSGGADMIVLKLNGNGTYQWHTFYGSDSDDYANAAAVDDSGNVYVTGYSSGEWNGDGDQAPLHAYGDHWANIVVLKLNSIGEYQWHTFYGPAGVNGGEAIASDRSGNVYITGVSWGAWSGDGGQGPLHPYSGGSGADIFVLKLSDVGAYQWHTFYGSVNDDWGTAITVDVNGSVDITGRSYATWNGDGDRAPLHAYSGSGGLSEIFLLKLYPSGAYQWHTFYGAGGDSPNGIAADSGSNIYVTGNSAAVWNGDGGQTPLHAYSGSGDIFVLKMAFTCPATAVNIQGTASYYTSIQEAYSNLTTNDQSLLLQGLTFTEPDLDLANSDTHNIVTLRGGYECGFMLNTGWTTINGTLTIGTGTVTIEKITIR